MSKILSLPREIVVDIVSRLPISSLLQIKLVCKSWRQLLQDPHLPSLHFSRLKTTMSSDPCLILHSRNCAHNELYFLDMCSLVKEDDGHPNENKLKKLVVPPTILKFVVLGSCRGILCFANLSQRAAIYLYNPLLAELKEIPKTICGPSYNMGFGFHQETKEYKLVTIVAVVDRDSLRFRTARSSGSALSVITLTAQNGTRPNEPTSWRRLGLVPYHFVVHQAHQVLVSGRLHWTAFRRTRGPNKHVVVSFDLSDEVVREVPMPPICSCERNCRCKLELMVAGARLGIVEYDVGGEIKIWVMMDYGAEESWANEINIDGVDINRDGDETIPSDTIGSARRSRTYFHETSDFRVLWVMRNGEVLLEYKRRGLICYDPRNRTWRDVLPQGGGLFVNGFNAFVHDGSFSEIDC
ncbi:unnamed protein product [Linum trigynum]